MTNSANSCAGSPPPNGFLRPGAALRSSRFTRSRIASSSSFSRVVRGAPSRPRASCPASRRRRSRPSKSRGVRYRTIYASEQLVKARHLIAKEKDAINLLRAEYAHLARPDRLQALADSKLGMQALTLSQIATVGDLPEAQPKVDSIGRTLESLGFLKDSATPVASAGGETPPVR